MDAMQILRFLLYFIIYSFFGWILESIYKSFIEKRIINSGFLFGPFCPIYGFGACIMILCLEPFKNNAMLLFATSFVVMSIWEYIVGWLLEKQFNTKYWDYTGNFLNIKGRVCLKNSTFWGALGVIFMMWIHPVIEKYVIILNNATLLYLNIILLIAIGIDAIITIVKMKSLESTVEAIKELGETIKTKISELKDLGADSIEKVKGTEIIIEDLKRKEAILKVRLYRYVTRLKKAFPTIKSDSISQLLNQKIDLKALKGKIKKKIDKK